MVIRWIVLFQFTIAFSAQAKECLTTQDIAAVNPKISEPRTLFWRSDVKQGIRMAMVKMPDSDQLYFNLLHCNAAKVPTIATMDDWTDVKCVPVGQLWMPLGSLEDENSNGAPMVKYFRDQTSARLEEYASSFYWDPTIQMTIASLNQAFVGAFGFSLYSMSTAFYPKTTRGQRIGRRLFQGIGLFWVIRSLYMSNQENQTILDSERNKKAEQIEELILKIENQIVLRFDGQEKGDHLESPMSVLISSLEKSSNDTYEKYCNPKLITNE